MDAVHAVTPAVDRHKLSARFWQATFLIWRNNSGRATGLALFLVALVVLQLAVQVLLNLWNRNFFDALARRNAHDLWIQIEIFFPLAAAAIALSAVSVWGRMTAQRGWREAMSRYVIGKWLDHSRFRRLNHLTKGSENPEYRIAVDVRIATDAPVDMALAMLSSALTAVTFFGVLWTIGGSIDVVVFDRTVTIPGYLVFGVIAYSGVMAAIMIFFGHYLTNVIDQKNQSEAELRAAVDAFRAEPEQRAISSSTDKRNALWLGLQTVLLWWREYAWQLATTTIVSYGNVLLAPTIAWILCVPKYLSGTMSLGELTQTAAAFVVVQTAFNWLVDNYQRLAEWRSSAHRVATLLLALDEIEAKERTEAPSPSQ